MVQEVLGSREQSILDLYKILREAIKREEEDNQDIEHTLNSRKYLRAWRSFCIENNLDIDEGRCSHENIQAALVIFENEITQKTIPFCEQLEQVRTLVGNIITTYHKKPEEDHKINLSENLRKYLETGEGFYAPELVIQFINKDNIVKIHENVLRLLIRDPYCRYLVISCITSENIVEISNFRGLINGAKVDMTKNLIYGLTGLLKGDELVKMQRHLCSLVENRDEIPPIILDRIAYGGSAGEFIRSFDFAPKSRRRRFVELMGLKF